jgi:hypothetical protein
LLRFQRVSLSDPENFFIRQISVERKKTKNIFDSLQYPPRHSSQTKFLDYHEQSKLKPPPRQEVDRLLQQLTNSINRNSNSSSSWSRPAPTCTQPVQKVKIKARILLAKDFFFRF